MIFFGTIYPTHIHCKNNIYCQTKNGAVFITSVYYLLSSKCYWSNILYNIKVLLTHFTVKIQKLRKDSSCQIASQSTAMVHFHMRYHIIRPTRIFRQRRISERGLRISNQRHTETTSISTIPNPIQTLLG